ncbi:hypothetical protein LTS18_008106, partial [Coniosporium uncinatum]
PVDGLDKETAADEPDGADDKVLVGKLMPMLLASESSDEIWGSADALTGRSAMMLLRIEAAEEAWEAPAFRVEDGDPEVVSEIAPGEDAPDDEATTVEDATGKPAGRLMPMLLARERIDEICGSVDALAGRSAMILLRTEAAEEAWETAGALFEGAVSCPDADDDDSPGRGAPTDEEPAVGEASGKLIPMLLASERIDDICGSVDALAGKSAMMLLRTEAADEACEAAGPLVGIAVIDPDGNTGTPIDGEMPVGAATDGLSGSCGRMELTTPRRDERAGSMMALGKAELNELIWDSRDDSCETGAALMGPWLEDGLMKGVVVGPADETPGKMPERMLLAADSNEDIGAAEPALSGKLDGDTGIVKDETAGPDPEIEEVRAGAALL